MITLSELLAAPASLNYDHLGDKNQPAQLALKEAKVYISKVVPPGYLVRISGVARNLPFIPWVAILDSDQTKTAQSGIYLVFLYSQDMSKLYLSLNQGFTAHESRASKVKSELKGSIKESVHEMAIKSITKDTKFLTSQLTGEINKLKNNISRINLGLSKHLAEDYEAGHIAGFQYDLKKIPAEDIIFENLEELFSLYAKACEVVDQNAILYPETWITTSGDNDYKRAQVTKNQIINYNDFRPRQTDPVHLKKQAQSAYAKYRSRKHEQLINDFVTYIKGFGFLAATDKTGKRDLMIKARDQKEFLVEAKTVKTDGEEAVRDAIGQLLAYRYEYYDKNNRPELIALFNLKIGEIWQGLLEELQIEWVYIHKGKWISSKKFQEYTEISA